MTKVSVTINHERGNVPRGIGDRLEIALFDLQPGRVRVFHDVEGLCEGLQADPGPRQVEKRHGPHAERQFLVEIRMLEVDAPLAAGFEAPMNDFISGAQGLAG